MACLGERRTLCSRFQLIRHLRSSLATSGSLVVLILTGCSAGVARDPRMAGAGCEADDFATGNVIFFGLADDLGPGTILKPQAGNRAAPEYLLDAVVPGGAPAVVHTGVNWTCALGDSVSRAFNANRGIGILPVDDHTNEALARASRLTVTVDAVRWDDLLMDPFRTAIDQLRDPKLKADLLGGRYLVVSRAFVVQGIKLTAVFDSATGAVSKAALGEGRRRLTQGKVSALVNVVWENNTKLVITAPSDIYIAGQLRRLEPGGPPPPPSSIGGGGTPEGGDSSGRTLVRIGGL
jgi:hypothetical protein